MAPKPRILICAPSNAAADELLQRIMGTGFHDVQVECLMMPLLSDADPECNCRRYLCSCNLHEHALLMSYMPHSRVEVCLICILNTHILLAARGVLIYGTDHLLSKMPLMV